jgi:CubicO group peptidase (beta-lactamase class C family)
MGPGGGLAYSNSGYGLLGYALERAAGVPLENVMRQRLWEPLGMEHTFVSEPPPGAPQLVAHHWDW